MKRFILLAIIACATVFPIAALEGFETKTIKAEVSEKNVSVELQYTEETKNLVVIYTIKYRKFDEADAVITIRDIVKKFCDERGFKHYKTYSDDIIKYHGKDTELTRFFILSE
jgi:uncharacterized protein YihD (DUF1040 family)